MASSSRLARQIPRRPRATSQQVETNVLPDGPTARGAGVHTPFNVSRRLKQHRASHLSESSFFRPTGGPTKIISPKQGTHATNCPPHPPRARPAGQDPPKSTS